MKKVFFILFSAILFFNTATAAEVVTNSVEAKNICVFAEKNKFGLKDSSGNIIIKPIYKKLIRVGEYSWIVQKGNKFGLVDNSGNILVKIKYSHVDRYFDKYSKFGNENDYGLYDAKGNVLIPPEFTQIEPTFGGRFITYKDYKYGLYSSEGKELLENRFDGIYMPNPKVLRIKYEGEWVEIERITKEDKEIELPEGVKKVTVNGQDFKVTNLLVNTGVGSAYGVVTFTDYILKLFSSISPSYEATIDELMYSQGAESVSIIMKCSWLPRFPYIYIKKYISNLKDPSNGPLSTVKDELKTQIK